VGVTVRLRDVPDKVRQDIKKGAEWYDVR